MTKCLDSSPNRADDQSPEAEGLYSLLDVQETIVDFDPPAHYEKGAGGVSENATEVEPGFGEALTETKAAKSDKWTAHRADAQRLAKSLRRAKSKYGQEVSFCATELNLYKYEDTGSYGVRPFQTCKKRWCPICSWHASQKRWAAAQQRLPGLLEAQPDRMRWRLLTLTLKNVPADELKSTVRHMLKSFRRLTQQEAWTAKGWIRALEVTHSKRKKTFHPHIHVLFSTPWAEPRRETVEWISRWRKAAQLDYDPVCDVRAVRSRDLGPDVDAAHHEAMSGMAETAKYTLKPSTLIGASAVDVVAAMESLRGQRLVEGGGFLRGVFKEIEPDEDEVFGERSTAGVFWWRAKTMVYRRVKNLT